MLVAKRLDRSRIDCTGCTIIIEHRVDDGCLPRCRIADDVTNRIRRLVEKTVYDRRVAHGSVPFMVLSLLNRSWLIWLALMQINMPTAYKASLKRAKTAAFSE
jgi:hypothetical protein